MRFDKTIKEEKIKEDDLDLDGIDDSYDDYVEDYAEVEMTLAEPGKLVDIDGSVVLVGPGDEITIRSESIKRINKTI